MFKPKVLNSKIVFKSFFNVQEDHLLLPDSKEMKYYFLKSKEVVSILPITQDNKLIVNKQYRHATGEYIYDLPAGYIDEKETPEQAAFRELKEETGYESSNIKKLGVFYPLAGVTNMKIYFFKATDLKKIGNQQLDQAEFIDNELIPLKEVKEKILKNEWKDMPLAFCFLLNSILDK